MVAAWPGHKTDFYVEWLVELQTQHEAAEDAAVQAELDALHGNGVGLEGLAGIGAQVREVH